MVPPTLFPEVEICCPDDNSVGCIDGTVGWLTFPLCLVVSAKELVETTFDAMNGGRVPIGAPPPLAFDLKAIIFSQLLSVEEWFLEQLAQRYSSGGFWQSA